MEFIAFLLVLQITISLLLAGLLCFVFYRYKRYLQGVVRLLHLVWRFGKKLLSLLRRLWQSMSKVPPDDLDAP